MLSLFLLLFFFEHRKKCLTFILYHAIYDGILILRSKVMKINVEIEATEMIVGLLVSAFEGGSNYWYKDLSFIDKPEDQEYWLYLTESIEGKKERIFYLYDSEGKQSMYVGWDSIARGLQTMVEVVPHHFADVLRGDIDQITGDCFLQCVTFGDVIYG